jgi:hypothetical protein
VTISNAPSALWAKISSALKNKILTGQGFGPVLFCALPQMKTGDGSLSFYDFGTKLHCKVKISFGNLENENIFRGEAKRLPYAGDKI